MIIDARLASVSGPHRAYTVSQAVCLALGEMDVGSSVVVENLFDQTGKQLCRGRLSMHVTKLSAGRVFSVRKTDDGIAKIYRIA